MLGGVRRGNAAHDSTCFDHAAESTKFHTLLRKTVADFDNLNRIAQIGLIRAVFCQSLAVGNLRKRFADFPSVGELFEQSKQHGLKGIKDILLLNETHLDIELVELSRRPVGAGILVTKTGRDLKVSIKTGNHGELLKLLRRLGESIELPRMHSGRNKEVSSAFRRRCRKYRCLVFEKPRARHPFPYRGDDFRAQHDVAVHGGAPKIEKAVLQADIFRERRLAEHGQRQGFGAGQYVEILDAHFHFARGNVFIDGLRITLYHLAVHTHDRFGRYVAGKLKAFVFGLKNALGYAVVVAQIQEQQAAVVTLAVQPSGQANLLAVILESEFITIMASKGMHNVLKDALKRA